MPLPRLEHNGRVADHVFAAIHAAIISGELPAGTRLRIRELAEELGTSVMPVREAIRRLEEVGLAAAEPYRGAVVKGFTPTELLDLYSTRHLLETEATRLGATEVSPEDLLRMKSEYDAMSAALVEDDALGYLDRDEGFLSILYRASGNAVLVELVHTLWHRCRSYKILGVRQALDTGHQADLLTYQKQLLRAVVDHDPARASRVTAESLDAAIQRIRSSMVDA